jgi:flagellar L-ring protein FlgH
VKQPRHNSERIAPLTLQCAILITALLFPPLSHAVLFKKKKQPKVDARTEYLQRMQQSAVPPEHTMGSLWSPSAPLTTLATDYKANKLYDSIVITVVESTAAQASRDITGQRTLAINSAVTSVGGMSPTESNPLLSATSSNQLKGTGQTNASSSIRTSLSGQIIAVLPNGNFVVEAERRLTMSNQSETMIVRGVVRPFDIDQFNQVPSTSVTNLEVELKGKGVISDYTRPMNPVTRAIMWVLGF